jgi:hypothetical protein
MTVLSQPEREERIQKELDDVRGRPDTERIPIPWKNERGRVFDVVNLSLDCAVLNPNSHRVKEQLESNPAEQAIVTADPYGEEGQEILAKLLSETEHFDDLQANLDAEGQNEAGVITAMGVLINANRRAVALRRLGQTHIRVVVLPKEPDPADIARLELSFQMKRDFRQDYTFVNQLLFIEDIKRQLGYSDEDVAKAMGLAKGDLRKGAAEVRRQTRMLALIREIQSRSEGRVPLHFFNDRAIALAEIDDIYEGLRERDPANAERVKELRVLAILVGTEYRDIRLIRADTASETVLSELRRNEAIGDTVEAVLSAETGMEVPDLGDLADEPTEAEPDISALVDLVARSHEQETVTVPAGEGTATVSREELRQGLAESLGDAAEDIRNLDRDEKKWANPTRLVHSARDSAERALVAYKKAEKDPAFATKRGKLEYELRKLCHAVEALQAAIEKHQR